MPVYKTDRIMQFLSVIDAEHSEVHEGCHYFYTQYVDALANSATQYFVFRVPANINDSPHVTFRASLSLGGKLDIYEGASLTFTAGTVTGYNNNRNSTNNSAMKLCVCATTTQFSVTTPGTLIWSQIMGAAKEHGAIDRGQEIILATNTTYTFITTSWAASNTSSLVFEWYE